MASSKLGPLYLIENAADKAATWHSSGASGPVRGPIDAQLATGSAELDIKGAYNAEGPIDFELKCEATTGLGVQPMVTTPLADSGNVGDGTISVTVHASNTTVEDWIAECISSGTETTNATGTSDDYDEYAAAGSPLGIYVESRLAGELGNGQTVEIMQGVDTQAWSWTKKTSTTQATTAPTGDDVGDATTRLLLSSTPQGQIAEGNIICIAADSAGSPDATDLTTWGVYRVAAISPSGAGQDWIEIQRTLRADVPAGKNIWVLAAASGFRVKVYDPSGPTTEYFDRTQWSTPIRTTAQVMSVLINGGKYWDGASYVDQSSTLVTWHDEVESGGYPPEIQTGGKAITLSGGETTPVGTGYAQFRIESGQAGDVVDADGSPHTLDVADKHKLVVTITQGSIRFAVGDTFRWSTRAAKFSLSRNGGAFSGSYYAADGGTNLTDGLTMEWTLSGDTTPWVVGDKWRWRSDYQFRADNLRSGDRNLEWRTLDPAVRHAYVCDAGVGKTLDVQGVWVLDVNLSSSGTLLLGGSDVQPYGTITAVSPPLVANQLQDSAWEGGAGPIDHFKDGYMTITSGAARGKSYQISANTTDGIFTFQAGDTPTADGAAVGDQYVLIEDSYTDVFELVESPATYRLGVWSSTTYSRRYWVLVIYDPGSGAAYAQISTLWFGVPIQPTAAPYYRPDHRQTIYAPRVVDTPSGRRRVLTDNVMRTKISHDYLGEHEMGVSDNDRKALEQIVTTIWGGTGNTIKPLVIVEDDSDPATFNLVDLQPDPTISQIRSNAWAAVLVFETRERAG